MTPVRGAGTAAQRHAVELALLGLLALLWGSSYTVTKVAVDEIPPLTLVGGRVAIAALFLLAVMLHQRQRLPSDAVTWRQLLLQAVFNSIGSWTLLAWGQQRIDSALSSVLNSTSPLFVVLLTVVVFRHERIGGLRLAGAGLGLLGVVLIIGPDVLAGLGQQVAGQLAALAGALLYACAAIYGRRFAHLPPAVTAAGTMLWATACLLPLGLILERPWSLSPSAGALAATAVLGLFNTGLALLIYFRLVRTLGSLGVASQSYLRAGVGVLLGMLLLGEQIPLTAGCGLLAAIVGVAAINAPSGFLRATRLAATQRKNETG